MLRTPRLAGVKADYDRTLKQRNALLKSAIGDQGFVRRLDPRRCGTTTSSQLGSELLHERLTLVSDLRDPVQRGVRRSRAGRW